MTECIRTAVSEAYEEKAMENGQITMEQIKNVFLEYENGIKTFVGEQITLLRNEMPVLIQQEPTPREEDTLDDFGVPFADGEQEEPQQPQSTTVFRNFAHSGRFWFVPKLFKLPRRVKLETGWRLWVQGLPGFQMEDGDHIARAAPIRPFRKFKNGMLPPEVKKTFGLHWSPIFKVMEETPGLEIPNDPSSIDGDFLANSFACAKEYLKEHRVQYAFQKLRANPDEWEVSTWSKHVRRSEIEKYGTEVDKANLPVPNRFNGSRVQHSKRKRTPMDDNQRRRIARKSTQRPNARANDTRTVDEFQLAFGVAAEEIEVTPRMRALDEIIQREVQQEARHHELERRARRNQVGDAVATDGSVLFVQQEPRGQLRNDGHLSNIERRQYAHHVDSMICAAGDRCEMNGAPAPSTHRCQFCDRNIHAICGILIENAPNEFHNRRCFDCQFSD
jgi:hypothetical protein